MKMYKTQILPFEALRQRALTLLKNVVAFIKKPRKVKQIKKKQGFCIYCLMPKRDIYQHMQQCKFKHVRKMLIDYQSTSTSLSSSSSSGTYSIPY